MEGYTTSSKSLVLNLSLFTGFVCDVFVQECLSFLKHLYLVAIIQSKPSGSILRMVLSQELKEVGCILSSIYSSSKYNVTKVCCSNFILLIVLIAVLFSDLPFGWHREKDEDQETYFVE